MPSENAEVLRQAYDTYNREGISGILRYLDTEVEWRNPAESPNAGVFIGHDGVLKWQRMVDESFKQMRFEPERMDELPDGRVLAVVRFRFRSSSELDVDVEVPFAHLVTFRDGRVTAFSMYLSEAAALEAVRVA
jgi:ketosteroid isomerase-like protein